MSDSGTTMQETQSTTRQSRRGSKIVAVFIVVLTTLAAVCGFAYYLNSRSRYKVVGKMDPATGYRIDYTVSSRYHESTDDQGLEDRNTLEANTFKPRQMPKAAQWFYEHVLRRTAQSHNSGPISWKPGAIGQHTYRGGDVAGLDTDEQGYPDLSFMRRFTTNMVQDHVLISGCPATWCAFNTPGSGAGKLRTFTLIVQPKDQALVYSFEGLDDKIEPTGVASEMKKIRDSIRITKAR